MLARPLVAGGLRSAAAVVPTGYRAMWGMSQDAMRLGTAVDRADPDSVLRQQQFEEARGPIVAAVDQVTSFGAGGAERSRTVHVSRGKMLVRDRVTGLLDTGSFFLEIGQLAAHEVYGKENVASAGLVCGVGLVHGSPVMVVANDATVRGGTYYPLTVKKHLRAQEIARQCNLPCVYLVDSGGANLPRQADVFPDRDHFGRIFYNQATMSAAGLPQIAVVMGSCTAGGAYVPAMCDESIIVNGTGTVFLGGPPLVQAATGEVVSAEDLGGARVHTRTSGVCDHLAHNDLHALHLARSAVANAVGVGNNTNVPATLPAGLMPEDVEPPAFPADDLPYIVGADLRKPYDARQVISRLVDGSRLHEFKQQYAETLVTGFAHIHGQRVGIIANNGILFGESAAKGAHFIQLCAQRKVPLLFLHNISGFMVGRKYENGGIAKDGAKLVTAVACANVPKVTLITGGSFGAGTYGMCGRAYSPNFLWMWPNGRVGVMGGEQAANVLATVKRNAHDREADKQREKGVPESEIEQYDTVGEETFKQSIRDGYDAESHALFATARMWDDGIIMPEQTRDVLGLSFKIASHNKPLEETKFGVIRM